MLGLVNASAARRQTTQAPDQDEEQWDDNLPVRVEGSPPPADQSPAPRPSREPDPASDPPRMAVEGSPRRPRGRARGRPRRAAADPGPEPPAPGANADPQASDVESTPNLALGDTQFGLIRPPVWESDSDEGEDWYMYMGLVNAGAARRQASDQDEEQWDDNLPVRLEGSPPPADQAPRPSQEPDPAPDPPRMAVEDPPRRARGRARGRPRQAAPNPDPEPPAPGANVDPPETAEIPLRECRICYAREADACFEPCHHAGICGPCALKIMFSGEGTCPFCRVSIIKMFRLYY